MLTIGLWVGFLAIVMVILAIDLGVLNRGSRTISPARALLNTGVFVFMALAFTVVIYVVYERGLMSGGASIAHDGSPMNGAKAATEYLSTWLLEYALSVDNLFVFTIIFGHFSVPQRYQHRVLFWGILGALILRGVMIGAGSALVQQFYWVLYIFGALLIYTAFKMVFAGEGHFDPSRSFMLRLARAFFPVTGELHAEKFFVHVPPETVGRPAGTGAGGGGGGGAGGLVRAATPLFLVLLVVEATDVMFALDSIPAAFGQTREPFIIFTSNVFAIMGLRSLYFALAGLMSAFRFLKVSLALILVFVGVKLMIAHPVGWLGFAGYHIGSGVSLGVIVTSLAAGVLASLMLKRESAEEAAAHGGPVGGKPGAEASGPGEKSAG